MNSLAEVASSRLTPPAGGRRRASLSSGAAPYLGPSDPSGGGRSRSSRVGVALLAVVSLLLFVGCFLPARQPPGPVPEPCLEVPGPWCHEAGLTCDCRHQPPGDKCPSWVACSPIPTPTPTPEPVRCTLGTPTALALLQAGQRVDIRPEIHGANVSATPRGEFGSDYYCQPEMGWPEACASMKHFGPVAPDGHPQRMACEAVFLGQPCPTFSMATCGSSAPGACPVTFDPFYVVDGINQNHPVNVAAGCNGADWQKVGGHVVEGMFWLATAHGRGTIKACNAGAKVCTESRFEVDH